MAYALASRILSSAVEYISSTLGPIQSQSPSLKLSLDLTLPKAVLRASSASVHVSSPQSDNGAKSIQLQVKTPRFRLNELPVHTIVGINPHERLHKQPVVLDLEFLYNPQSKVEAEKPLPSSFKFPFAQLEARISDVRPPLTLS